MEKINHLPNGQWTLSKSNQQFNNEGETHEVEVHPDLDQLYRAKDVVKRSGRPYLHIQDIKHTGAFNDLINKIPRDATGKVTAKMIDDHIEKLPKQKVIIKTAPYEWKAQLHHNNAKEHVVSVQLHPDTLSKLNPNTAQAWDNISEGQHKLTSDSSSQIGWARIDPKKQDHWHIDEIQSDFNSKKKIDKKIDDSKYTAQRTQETKFQNEVLQQGDSHPHRELQRRAIGDNIFDGAYMMSGGNTPKTPEFERWRQIVHDAAADRISKMGDTSSEGDNLHKLLSHGHDDPQHLVHSAINALARKKGINSISMDSVNDQAESSGLVSATGGDSRNVYERHLHHWPLHLDSINDGTHPSSQNPNFKSALGKIGTNLLTNMAKYGAGSTEPTNVEDYISGLEYDEPDNYEQDSSNLKRLSDPEKHAINEMLTNYDNALRGRSASGPKVDLNKLPVHFLDTYHKRPKKLGYQSLPKDRVMDASSYNNQQVQYSPVFKMIEQLKDKLMKIKSSK